MTRRKGPTKGDEHDNGVATVPEGLPCEGQVADAPLALPLEQQTAETPPVVNGNGHHANGERKPYRVLSYLIGPDTYVQASIWQRDAMRKDGVSFTTWDVSIRKRYVDQRDGQWKSLYSFHASEMYAIIHALQQATAMIAELRRADIPF